MDEGDSALLEGVVEGVGSEEEGMRCTTVIDCGRGCAAGPLPPSGARGGGLVWCRTLEGPRRTAGRDSGSAACGWVAVPRKGVA